MSAVTCTGEIPSQIGSWFAESRPRKKENEAKDESCEMSQEDQLNAVRNSKLRTSFGFSFLLYKV